jgi:hypothetical protein
VIAKIQKVWKDKICEPAKEIMEKEAKARRKKLRRKWRKFIERSKNEKFEQIACKLKRKNLWKKIEKQRYSSGMIMKKKIMEFLCRAEQRNVMLLSLFKTAANNIAITMKRKTEVIRRRKELFDKMKEMSSSVNEMKLLKEEYSNQEEIYNKGWHNKFEEDEKIISQFEEDNVFCIDKKTWNEIINKGIIIKFRG